MTELLVPIERLRPDPAQARRTFRRIEELAELIAKYTLLQNLVVKPGDADGFHVIVAGERRYRALMLLASQGRLPDHNVRCVIASGDCDWAGIVENVSRDDVPLWELGRKYIDLYETGLTQAEIAARIGKTQGHISTAMTLARNLAPSVILRLSKLPPNTFPAQRLLRLAALLNEHGEPDDETQQRLFQQMLGAPARKGRRAGFTRSQKEIVWDRYQRLCHSKVNLGIDPAFNPFLDSVLRYLRGEVRRIS
jgi:ParB/RepB/Spo0J family partition protein